MNEELKFEISDVKEESFLKYDNINAKGIFCIQFDDDEPIEMSGILDVAEVTISMSLSEGQLSSTIEFSDGKKMFKMFIKPVEERR